MLRIITIIIRAVWTVAMLGLSITLGAATGFGHFGWRGGIVLGLVGLCGGARAINSPADALGFLTSWY